MTTESTKGIYFQSTLKLLESRADEATAEALRERFGVAGEVRAPVGGHGHVGRIRVDIHQLTDYAEGAAFGLDQLPDRQNVQCVSRRRSQGGYSADQLGL